jgi:hypothetical protein
MHIHDHFGGGILYGCISVCGKVIQKLLHLFIAILFVVPLVFSMAIELNAMRTVIYAARA